MRSCFFEFDTMKDACDAIVHLDERDRCTTDPTPSFHVAGITRNEFGKVSVYFVLDLDHMTEAGAVAETRFIRAAERRDGEYTGT